MHAWMGFKPGAVLYQLSYQANCEFIIPVKAARMNLNAWNI